MQFFKAEHKCIERKQLSIKSSIEENEPVCMEGIYKIINY